MTELSKEVAARSRKIHTGILQHFAHVKNTTVAARACVSDSTISRFLSEDLGKVSMYLAAAGLQVVPADAQVIERDIKRVLFKLARDHIDAELAHDEMVDTQLEQAAIAEKAANAKNENAE